ncbi:hypothetical protein [Gemmobacter serpentinus]|uniref:hypothetical protein n=1 Tax=Gemmobacter serpentinus TaxID=2652247 RepID=UPI00124C7844|nr:hypothetical protein [Gemmobacter serpentinus]
MPSLTGPRAAVALSAMAVTLAMAVPLAAQDYAAGLLACRRQSDTMARLACYDALPAKAPGTVFRGTGSQVTPPFDLQAPTLLSFESMDAIMVVYLLDGTGAVVQNLHQAGAGTASYLIRHPGRYSLQVNASGGWRMSLEKP